MTTKRSLRDVAGMSHPVTIAALYKFSTVADPSTMRNALALEAERLGIRGILLVAHEGLNGTIAGSATSIQNILIFIKGLPGFSDLDYKLSQASKIPFRKLRVRVKKEIVTFGQPQADPNKQVGTYVEASDWNALIADPDVILIDTRNDYEVGFGTFEGALDPRTQQFRDFATYVRENLDPSRHRKVAMFCTGGIRCEKASSFMKAEGFDEVYHLKGGILKYLEEVPEEQSKWQGGCFVFDDRMSVGHGVVPMPLLRCFHCSGAITEEMTQQPGYEAGVSCPACVNEMTAMQLRSARERQRQLNLAKQRAAAETG